MFSVLHHFLKISSIFLIHKIHCVFYTFCMANNLQTVWLYVYFFKCKEKYLIVLLKVLSFFKLLQSLLRFLWNDKDYQFQFQKSIGLSTN